MMKMSENDSSDDALLKHWLATRSEVAFRALVGRYAGLVHMAAMRTCGDASLAAEASQNTFIALAEKAGALASRKSLAGWLHLTAVMQAKNLHRKQLRDTRKVDHFRQQMNTTAPEQAAIDWGRLSPLLDEALSTLPAKDREALLLRFYRSLSIQDVAATLDIAHAAAQKRVNRATERLRRIFERKGVQTSGSLGAVMAAGFRTDAQAAHALIDTLTHKTIAAGAVSSFGLSAILTSTAALMKSSSIIPPALSLLIVGGWVGIQRQSISAMEKESVLLRQQIADVRSTSQASAGVTKKRTTSGKLAKDKEPIDWKTLAPQVVDWYYRRDIGDLNTKMRFDQRMQSMTKEERLAALEEISALDLPADARRIFALRIIGPLQDEDPEFALTHCIDCMKDALDVLSEPLSEALKNLAKKDPAKAQAWLDQQIASGKFDSKSLDDENHSRMLFEGKLFGVLIGTDPEAAEKRLQAIPVDQRFSVMAKAPLDLINEDKQLAYADLIRRQLPYQSEKSAMIAKYGNGLVRGDGFTAVDAYLDRIAATPGERTATIREVAFRDTMEKFSQNSANQTFSRENLDAIHEWVSKQAPGNADTLFGAALASAAHFSWQGKFVDSAALAQQYDAASGNQDVLTGFLEDRASYFHRDEVRELAQQITDEKRREQILKHLK